MEPVIILNLTPVEIDIILQMIDKTQVAGVQSMRALLSLDMKIRQAVSEAQAQKENPAD